MEVIPDKVERLTVGRVLERLTMFWKAHDKARLYEYRPDVIQRPDLALDDV